MTTAQGQVPSRVGACIAERYQLLRVIGRGGTATVYEAEHVVTQRRVAVKTIEASIALSVPTIAIRFLREARAAAQIRHPGLVDVLDAGQEEDGSLYLVLELLDGEDLGQALRGGHIDPFDVTDVVIEVLDALQAMHVEGFVHRDVKPSNIFLARGLDGERRVKLLDLGIAKQIAGDAVQEITAHGVLLGTLHFMSPEQALGSVIDARTDIWGVGATLFYAWAGRPPFTGKEPGALLRAVMEETPPSVSTLAPTIPEALAAVIDRALERSSTRRHASAEALRRTLQIARAARPRYETLELKDTQRLEAPPPRRRWARVVLPALALGALAAWALMPAPGSIPLGTEARRGAPAIAAPAPAASEGPAHGKDGPTPANTSRAPAKDGLAPANTSRAPANASRTPANASRAPTNASRAPAKDGPAPAKNSPSPASAARQSEPSPTPKPLAATKPSSRVTPPRSRPVPLVRPRAARTQPRPQPTEASSPTTPSRSRPDDPMRVYE